MLPAATGDLQTATSSPEPLLELLPAGLAPAEAAALEQRAAAAAGSTSAACDLPLVELAYPKVRSPGSRRLCRAHMHALCGCDMTACMHQPRVGQEA